MFKSEMSTHRFMHSNTWLVFGGAAGGAYGSFKDLFCFVCIYLENNPRNVGFFFLFVCFSQWRKYITEARL